MQKLPKSVSLGNMQSASTQAKIDKDKVNRTNDKPERTTQDIECGLKNPCVFGKWNEKSKEKSFLSSV